MRPFIFIIILFCLPLHHLHAADAVKKDDIADYVQIYHREKPKTGKCKQFFYCQPGSYCYLFFFSLEGTEEIVDFITKHPPKDDTVKVSHYKTGSISPTYFDEIKKEYFKKPYNDMYYKNLASIYRLRFDFLGTVFTHISPTGKIIYPSSIQTYYNDIEKNCVSLSKQGKMQHLVRLLDALDIQTDFLVVDSDKISSLIKKMPKDKKLQLCTLQLIKKHKGE